MIGPLPLPLNIAELLIKCTPAFGVTGNDDATTMILLLHPHTNASLASGNQQDPILILGHIARGASRAFPVQVLLFSPPEQLLERGREVLSEGHLVGGGPLNWTETNTACAPRKVRKVISSVDAVGVKQYRSLPWRAHSALSGL